MQIREENQIHITHIVRCTVLFMQHLAERQTTGLSGINTNGVDNNSVNSRPRNQDCSISVQKKIDHIFQILQKAEVSVRGCGPSFFYNVIKITNRNFAVY